MSLGNLYQCIYLLVVTIVTVMALVMYNNQKRKTERPVESRWLALAVLIFVTLFIGLRPLHSDFADMINYWVGLTSYSSFFQWNWHTTNLLWDNSFRFLADNQVATTIVFLLISVGYFGIAYLACRRLFPNDILSAYLVFLAAFSTFSYGTNGLKAGFAASVFLLALSYQGQWLKCILLMLVSLGCHHAMELPVVAFACTMLYRNPKAYMYFWILCLVVSFLHISFFQSFLAGLTDEQGAEYLIASSDGSYVTGFRIDFIIYSAIPIFLGWFMFIRYEKYDAMYLTIWLCYTLANSIWLLCMYASYTNRIAYLSWLMYPLVLIYPFLQLEPDKPRHSLYPSVVIYHLAFTLFMVVVYYGILK